MFTNEHIDKGINYLYSIQNADGGIPAISQHHPSCCWVTAEAIDAILGYKSNSYTNFHFVKQMCEFLLSTQITIGADAGGWSMMPTNPARASTLTTGHAVCALSKAKNVFTLDIDFCSQIDASIKKGYAWLESHKNSDGCWGLEPADENAGQETRIISTYFALLAYFSLDYDVNTSQTVRKAISYIKNVINDDGGFGYKKGEKSTAYHTARIVYLLIKSNDEKPKSKYVKKLMAYIKSTSNWRDFEKLDREPYVSSDAIGQTTFFGNTPIAIINACCLSNNSFKHLEKYADWLSKNQEDTGKWLLGKSEDQSIVESWSTNEAIDSLILLQNKYYPKKIMQLKKNNKVYKMLFITFLLLFVLSTIVLGAYTSIAFIQNIISKVPDWLRKFLITTLLGGLVLNFLSSWIYDSMKNRKKGVNKKNE